MSLPDPYNTAGFSTALTIISRAAVQCGLGSVSDPIGSTDSNIIQMVDLLNSFGNYLVREHKWTHLISEGSITTAGSATTYSLPSDFHSFIDQSGWNRSTRLPLLGPTTPQEVQFLKARLSGVLINVAMRLKGNVIEFPIAPPDGHTIKYEYISSNWVQSAAPTTTPDKTSVTVNTDIVIQDPELMIAGVKLWFKEAKGQETFSAQKLYDELIEHNIAKNTGAKMIRMGGSQMGEHVLDTWNLPVTGYG